MVTVSTTHDDLSTTPPQTRTQNNKFLLSSKLTGEADAISVSRVRLTDALLCVLPAKTTRRKKRRFFVIGESSRVWEKCATFPSLLGELCPKSLPALLLPLLSPTLKSWASELEVIYEVTEPDKSGKSLSIFFSSSFFFGILRGKANINYGVANQ